MTLALLLPDGTPHAEPSLSCKCAGSQPDARPPLRAQILGALITLPSCAACLSALYPLCRVARRPPTTSSPPLACLLSQAGDTFTRERATVPAIQRHGPAAAAAAASMLGAPMTGASSFDALLDPCAPARALCSRSWAEAVLRWSAAWSRRPGGCKAVPDCPARRFGTNAIKNLALAHRPGGRLGRAAILLPEEASLHASIGVKEEVSEKLMPTLNKGLIALCRAKPAEPTNGSRSGSGEQARGRLVNRCTRSCFRLANGRRRALAKRLSSLKTMDDRECCPGCV